MKAALTSVLILFIANPIFSQDLIVTGDRDSINCKITKVKSGNIYFTFRHNDETRNTLLPLSRVSDYKTGFYKTGGISGEKGARHQDYPRFKIAVNGGYSYQTAKIAESVPSDFRDYVRKLKSGYHFGGDITYFFAESLGFGAKYCLFKTSNSLDGIYLEDEDGDRVFGLMSDDLSVTFIGPGFSTRLLDDGKKNAFLMSVSLGYMGYSNNKVLIDKYKMTGSTVGLALDLGYDVGLSKNLSAGFQISLITGTLSKYNLSDGITTHTIQLEKDEYEGLNRIDFSIGLRFNK